MLRFDFCGEWGLLGFAGDLLANAGSLDWLGIVARIAHVLAAITLSGGIFYQCSVLIPALRRLPSEEARKYDEALRGNWSKLVAVSVLFLLVSGLYNYVVAIRMDNAGVIALPKYYHPLIGTKILLALVVFFLSSVLAGRSAAAERFREKSVFWLTVNSSLAVLIVCIAGILKVADKTPESPPAEVSTQVSET